MYHILNTTITIFQVFLLDNELFSQMRTHTQHGLTLFVEWQ